MAVAALSLGLVWGLGALGGTISCSGAGRVPRGGAGHRHRLYEKSRRLAAGETVRFADMLRPRRGASGHVLFVGAILTTLALLSAARGSLDLCAVLRHPALPGLDHIAQMLFTTPLGLSMLAVGAVVGGLFAAFAFAISVFSIPMLLDRKVDAFTAMGISIATAWQNIPVLLVWGGIVLVLTLIGLATFMVGFIILFPLLGHASWHTYAAMRIEG